MNHDKAVWICRGRVVTLARPVVMGILNVTPDSFSDGGLHAGVEAALAHAARMLEEGAAILDVGGESTRPGFTPVGAEEEQRRVLPVVRELRRAFPDCMISIDTMKSRVAEAALAAGRTRQRRRRPGRPADGGGGPGLRAATRCTVRRARRGAAFGTPGRLGGWMVEGTGRLLAKALEAGIPADRIVGIGFGFGKKRGENRKRSARCRRWPGAFRASVLVGARAALRQRPASEADGDAEGQRRLRPRRAAPRRGFSASTTCLSLTALSHALQ